MPVTPVDAPIDAAGARQRGVLKNMAIHLCWLVQIAGRVILYSRETEREEGDGEEEGLGQMWRPV